MTTFIVLASIAAYLTIAGLTACEFMRRYVRNTVAARMEGDDWERLEPFPDYERAYAVQMGILVGFFWPATLPIGGIAYAFNSAMDKEVRKITAEHEELAALREIAKREGWEL